LNVSTGYAASTLRNESWLNRCVTDNSPFFENPPVLLKGAGLDVVYNPSARDYEHDSLSYRFDSAQLGSYTSPWTYSYPLTCLGGNNPNPNSNPPTGFNINSQTGDLFFRPMQVQSTVLKIAVYEWRKDSLGVYHVIGKQGRDMAIIVIQNINDKLPSMSGPYSFEACKGQQICITISTNDLDLSDTTRIFWDKGIPLATWSDDNGGAKHATGNFCWTPVSNDIRSLPYHFNVTVTDDHCPLIGVTARSISIRVNPVPKNTRSYNKITCTLLELKAIPTSTDYNGATYTWYAPKLVGTGLPDTVYSSSQVCQYQFTQGGLYLVKNVMYLNGCAQIYIDTIAIDNDPGFKVSTLNDTLLCPGGTATLMADTASSYQWYDDTVLISGATSKTFIANKAGKYTIKKFNSGCYFVSNTIHIYEIKKPHISKPNPLCQGDVAEYLAYGRTGATYQWYRNGNILTGETSAQLKAKLDGWYKCLVTQASCTVITDSDLLTFLPLPPKPTVSLSGNNLQSSSTTSNQWYFDTLIIVGATNNFYTPPKSGDYRVRVTGSNGCYAFSDPYHFILGIAGNEFKSTIKISPNPFQHQIKIEMSGIEGQVNISIHDMQGRTIICQNEYSPDLIMIDTSNLNEGLYLLEIINGENKAIYKVAKQ